MIEKIGEVFVMKAREYPQSQAFPDVRVQVEPGTYPLFRTTTPGISPENSLTFWVMTGRIVNYEVDLERVSGAPGDGLFLMHSHIELTDKMATAWGKGFSPEEWDDFIQNETVCQEGHPDQRLRITYNELGLRMVRGGKVGKESQEKEA